jgi:hypothetical protein
LSRARVAIVAVVIVLFAVGGGVLVYANQSHGGGSRVINVMVTGAKSMSPSQWTAHKNDTVTIKITSDTDGELHLHGYDIAFDCRAGRLTTHTFKADKTGNFPIEWESTSTPLGDLVVT